MATTELSLHRTRATWPTGRQWALFGIQALFVVMVDAANDIFRGNIRPPNAVEAVHNARDVAAFEAAHGLFVEPAWQIFFHHTEHILGLTLTWDSVVRFSNFIYGFCHIFVTLAVAAWIFARHRERFAFVRNVMLITNAFALVAYEVFPMAPPRLTSGLMFDHHSFQFRDTMQHVIGSGKLNGIPLGYNAYSAMPSVHAAWAVIMGLSVLWLARNPLLRILGGMYPLAMVFAIVVTGNHFILDALGGASVVLAATLVALGWERVKISRRSQAKAPCKRRREATLAVQPQDVC